MTKRLITVALLCAASLASAQTVNPVLVPHVAYLDGNGFPCAGCSLYSYAAGTTTPLPTYKNSTLTANTNPIILDAAGAAFIWVPAGSYKFVLVDALGNTVWTVDNVPGSSSGGTISGNIPESQVTNLVADLAAKASTTATVNTHPLSSNIVISASDLTTGTLPHARLPVLLAGDIPALAESQVTGLVTDLAAKVPATLTVNGHALNTNIAVLASDLTGTLPHASLPALLSGDIPGGSVTYTTSTTASAADNGLIVKMDCAAPCTYTLPTAQISPTWFTPLVISTGSAAATVVLGATVTFNSSSTPPVLPAIIRANTNVSTGYMGSQIFVPVPNVQVSVGSFAIGATTCYGSTGSTTPATFSMPGLTTSMKVSAGYTGNPSAIVGWGTAGGLSIKTWPSAANTGSYLICNPTSGSITGGAITFVMGAQ